MNMTNSASISSLVQTNATASVQTNATAMGRLYQHFSSHESSTGTRLLLIVVLVVLWHLTVQPIRNVSEWLVNKDHALKSPLGFVPRQPKFVTLIQLLANGVTFVLYFLAMGLVLQELGVNLTGYLASASIIA